MTSIFTISVILTDQAHGQFQKHGHVGSLEELPLVSGAVAVQGETDTAVAFVFVGESYARAERHLGRSLR